VHDYIAKQRLGQLYLAPLDVVLSQEDVLQPDILFISKERSHIITEKNIQGAPELVIEILSPATADRDRSLKRKLYAKFGIKEYWIVDPESKSVEVMSLGEKGFETVRLYKIGESLSSPLLKGLSLNLSEIF
jgi:Uma2 family endonuclease